MRRLIAGLTLLAVLLALAGGTALAHANLIRSEPDQNVTLDRSPAEIRLVFSEPVDPQFSEIIVYNRARNPVTETKSRVDPADATVMTLALPGLGEGVYTVAWKALSTVDGHVTQGAYAFGVGVQDLGDDPVVAGGVATERPPVAAVVGKWVALLGIAGLVGGLLFALSIVAPVAAGLPLPGGTAMAEAWRDRFRSIALEAGGLAVVGLIAQTISRGVQITGSPGGAIGWLVSPTFWGTRQGWLTLGGLILVLLATALAAWAAGSGRKLMPEEAVAGRLLRGPAWWGALLLSAGVLLTLSLNSHQAAASAYTTIAVAADWLHLVATCAWLGGLFHLIVTWRPAAKVLPDRERLSALARLMPRFSAIGLFSVGILVATGFFNGWLEVGTPAGLTETLYGRVLLIKLALFLPMVALGAVNLLWVSPRLALAEAGGRKPDQAASYGGHFRRFTAIEVGLGVLVLLAVGVLTNSSPAYQAALTPKPITTQIEAGALDLVLTISPGQVGQNVFDLRITDASGRPVTNAERVRLQFEMTQMSMGQLTEELTPRGDGHYTARGSTLSMGGTWKVDTLFRRPDGDDVQAGTSVDVRALPVNPVVEPPGPGAWPVGWAIGPALLLIGLMLAFNARRLAPVGRRLATASVLVGFLTFIGGAYFFATAVQAGTSGLPQNPVAASPASIARGTALYQQYCATCHGARGRGDGPAARALRPPPVDLTVHANQHPPGQLFVWISQGVRGTAMPAFDPSLSDEDRWHLVNYIRSLAEPAR